ncbi:MAG: NAD(P)/FAD-dependent oxidoreductase [Bacteroidales bacterium]|nr:NAD(P)/FAD-dependent oxidoreductase [Bacteroidales bacterium]
MSQTGIIIGSGLGGLECGYILAGHGIKVTVLEQCAQIGGCLQSYRRHGHVFDTGFHYVGGLEKGQSLYPLFKYFSLLDLPWRKLDTSCFDKVMIGDKSFSLHNGYDEFEASLSEIFPSERENLHKYVSLLKSVGDNIYSAFSSDNSSMNELFQKSAYAFLDETISDPLLRKVLSGSSLKMELNASTLPLSELAQINSSFIQSAWRLDGSGSLIAEHLAQGIKKMGGDVRVSSRVTALREKDGKIAEVEVNGNEILTADWVISDAHPKVTLDLLESKLIKRIYRQRISSLKNSFGMFTVNVCLKKNVVPYQDSSLFVYLDSADMWRPNGTDVEGALVSYYVPEGEDKTYADSLDILCPMDYSLVEKWADLPSQRRTEEYEKVKTQKAKECIDLVKRWIPELEDGIESIHTSTPLTYSSYLSMPSGSAYGISKDCNNPLTTILSPRTPVQNLLLTGQNLNLHGVLGVSMTSVITCSAILGMDTLRQEILQNE